VFAKRLRWFVILMVALALVIVARLVDIQVLRAERYETLADNLLTRSVRHLPAPRGSILDRNGRVLVSDEPVFDISVRYEVLLLLLTEDIPRASREYLYRCARALRNRGRYPADMPLDQVVPQLVKQVDGLSGQLAALAGVTRQELAERAERIRWRVGMIRADVGRKNPIQKGKPVREENQYHALIRNVDEDLALTVRIELEDDHPWLRVVPTSRRVAQGDHALIHVLGRTGSASPRRIENDPLVEDELRGLRGDDRCGISGVERLAGLTVRGTKGRITEDFDRSVIERIDPIRGSDVLLTIDAELQNQVFAILERAVAESLDSENPAGGASAVVIDVATREVLALVSYPAYRYDEYHRDYTQLARDNRWQPLRFRAVANMYPPGSTCKVIALYGGLAEGVITVHTPVQCTGHFLPDRPDSFRCWIYNQYGMTHGPQSAEAAVRNSCNIYFYTLGDRLGVDRLCRWFSAFGLGRTPGTGLIEESPGIAPTSQWIAEHRRRDPRVYPADAWNFSIGQGEVSATPLQCANVAATVASGRWEPVKLVRDGAGNVIGGEPVEPIVFDERHMQVLRTGMWRVVNERGATAFEARLGSGEYEICGKTGSAQTSRRVIRKWYQLEWPDGRGERVVATSKREALARYSDDKPQVVADGIDELFPPRGPDGKLPSHAWFIAYTQPKATPRGVAPRGPSYAVSVIIEFGGSGGKVAGPVAKAIAELLVGRGIAN
jgi:penicillin-binding protein 2